MAKIFFLLLCLLIPVALQAQVVNLSTAQKNEFLSRHNYWRAQFGTPDVTWSDSIADYAKEWVEILYKDSCDYRHRTTHVFGENIYASFSTKINVDGIVDTWAEERSHYQGESMDGTNYQLFGHYTQVVWEKTVQIGCAIAVCPNGVIAVCNYSPPGNITGQSPKNATTVSEH